MIQESGKYYLYRHIRLDKNEPFYVGLGCKKDNKTFLKQESEYYRAYTKRGRNSTWMGITSRTEFDVEILMESDNKSFIEQKEIEFIKMYGRIDLGTGTLANLHQGGNYKTGHKLSEEQRENISNRQRGEKSYVAIKMYCNKTGKIFNSILEASKFYKIDSSSIADMARGLAKNTFDIMFYEDYLENDYRAFSFIDKTLSSVINYKTKEVFPSMKLAAESIGMNSTKLREYLSGTKCSNPTDFIKIKDYEKGLTPSTLFKGKTKKQEVYNIKTGETYSSVKETHEKTGISVYELYHKLGGSCVNNTDFIYKKDFEKGLLPKDLRVDGTKKEVIDTITLQKFGSIKEASDFYKLNPKDVARYLNPNSGRYNPTNLVYLKDYIEQNPDFECN